MFWNDPGSDIKILSSLLIALVIISALVFKKTKNILLSAFIFSFIGNIIFYTILGHWVAGIYNIEWLLYFSHYIWPVINLALLGGLTFNHFKNAKNNKRMD